MKTENRGGARTSLTKKIGRPKGEPTKTISFRVPASKHETIKIRLEVVLSEFLSGY